MSSIIPKEIKALPLPASVVLMYRELVTIGNIYLVGVGEESSCDAITTSSSGLFKIVSVERLKNVAIEQIKRISLFFICSKA
ncbi:MAG: hypothetical protein Tsb0014_09340 [Pleurocapsa sp.]